MAGGHGGKRAGAGRKKKKIQGQSTLAQLQTRKETPQNMESVAERQQRRKAIEKQQQEAAQATQAALQQAQAQEEENQRNGLLLLAQEAERELGKIVLQLYSSKGGEVLWSFLIFIPWPPRPCLLRADIPIIHSGEPACCCNDMSSCLSLLIGH